MIELYGNETIKPIDFHEKKEGIVVGNSNFIKEKFLEVFILELFLDTVPMKSAKEIEVLDNQRVYTVPNNVLKASDEFINVTNIVNPEKLVFETKLEKVNYIQCYPKVKYGDNIDISPKEKSWGTIKARYIPPVGSKVTVEFLNGDPKLPYYEFQQYYEFNPIIPGEEFPDPEKPGGGGEEGGGTNPPDFTTGFGYYRMLKPTVPFMKGNDVKIIQKKLKTLKYVFTKDTNEYNLEIQKAIIDFQTKVKLKVDGIIGPITFSTLMDRVAALKLK